MVYLFLCKACEDGDHEHCAKGFPAPKGVYGGSKCMCFVCSSKQEDKNNNIENNNNE